MIESYHDRVRSDIFDLVPAKAGRLLDFGGGIGATSVALKSQGQAEHITLLDQCADEAKDGVDTAIAIDLNDADAIAQALDGNGAFDCILALDILEHVSDPWRCAQMLAARLSEQGCMIVSLPNIAHLSVIWGLAKGRFEYRDAGIMDRTHLRWFTPKSARELAQQAGLNVCAQSMNYAGRKFRYPAKLTLGILDHIFASQIKMRWERPKA
jgi:2-polyprenyl-3-methyl-5-hydroxy-6-metoxy-1,4-benzoquinol methylase